MMQESNTEFEKDSAAHHLDISGIAWRSRKVLALSAVVFSVTALAVSFIVSPVYRAKTVLIPAADADVGASLGSALGDLGGIASLVGLGVAAKGDTVEAVAVLRSRHFGERFIIENDLVQKISQRSSGAVWLARQFGLTDAPSLSDAYKVFDRKIRRVSEDKRTGLVTIEVYWREPREAASWANDLAARLNEVMRQRAIREASASIAQIEKELQHATLLSVQQSMSRLLEVQVKRKTLATVRPEYVFRIVDPAVVPDRNDEVAPVKALYLLFGGFFGALVAFLFLFYQHMRNSRSNHV